MIFENITETTHKLSMQTCVGCSFKTACEEALRITHENKKLVEFKFNLLTIAVNENDSYETLLKQLK